MNERGYEYGNVSLTFYPTGLGSVMTSFSSHLVYIFSKVDKFLVETNFVFIFLLKYKGMFIFKKEKVL